jgi:hypothetical protein
MAINKLIPNDMSQEAWMAAIQVRPKSIMTSNSKLKKDGIWNVTLPAFQASIVNKAGNLETLRTCPSAGVCKSYCYAGLTGTYLFSKSMVKHARNLQYMLDDAFGFATQLVEEIKGKRNLRAIRWNDSGDFFNSDYWYIAKAVMQALPNVRFYAYSKMVSFFKEQQALKALPPNFTVVFSFGGTEDHLIDTQNDRHAKVFSSHGILRAAGYSNGTHTDRLATNPAFLKIGLVVHGNHKAMPKYRKIIKRVAA